MMTQVNQPQVNQHIQDYVQHLVYDTNVSAMQMVSTLDDLKHQGERFDDYNIDVFKGSENND